MPALTSGPRTAELRRTPSGVVLHLGHTTPGVTTYVERPVADLLTCSAGRPWQPNAMQPDGWWISRRPGEHRAGCRTGPVAVEIRLSFDADDRLNLELRWRNTGQRRLGDLAVGLLLDIGRLTDCQITLPGLIYNDNPSADPARAVPRIGPAPGGGFVAEEDRLPIPGANLEWRSRPRTPLAERLLPPSPRRSGDGHVRYGSLGLIRREGPVIAALSGVLMFDGKQDVRYVSKAETEATDDGYLTLLPGEVYTQQLILDWGPQNIAATPSGTSLERPIALRRRWAPGRSASTRSSPRRPLRWTTVGTVDGTVAGYTKFSDIPGNGPVKARHFLYGWTGQALKLAWCDARLGFNRATACGSTAVAPPSSSTCPAARHRTPGLRHNAYQIGSRRWTSFRAGGRRWCPAARTARQSRPRRDHHPLPVAGRTGPAILADALVES